MPFGVTTMAVFRVTPGAVMSNAALPGKIIVLIDDTRAKIVFSSIKTNHPSEYHMLHLIIK